MGAEEEQVVLAFFEAFAQDWPTPEKLDEALALFADDGYYQVLVPTREPIYGRDAIRAEIEVQMRDHAVVVKHAYRNMFSSGSVVFTERLDEAEINGKWIQVPIVGVWEVVDGKITAWRDYWDSLNVARQFGITPEEFFALGEDSPFGRNAVRAQG